MDEQDADTGAELCLCVMLGMRLVLALGLKLQQGLQIKKINFDELTFLSSTTF